jgi:hypothetical protein
VGTAAEPEWVPQQDLGAAAEPQPQQNRDRDPLQDKIERSE